MAHQRNALFRNGGPLLMQNGVWRWPTTTRWWGDSQTLFCTPYGALVQRTHQPSSIPSIQGYNGCLLLSRGEAELRREEVRRKDGYIGWSRSRWNRAWLFYFISPLLSAYVHSTYYLLVWDQHTHWSLVTTIQGVVFPSFQEIKHVLSIPFRVMKATNSLALTRFLSTVHAILSP